MATLDEHVGAHPVVAFVESDNAACDKLRALFQELEIELVAVDAPRNSPLREAANQRAAQSTLPAVFVHGVYIGGLNDGPQAWMGVTRLLATGKLHELIEGSSNAPGQVPTAFDFDLVVIGGGSGGLACAREAASDTSKKVAVFDYVKPSPQGSTWDIGGTCVNVGCIPKKLMHTAALHREAHEDAKSFGVGGGSAGPGAHDWATMVSNVQKHIGTLNEGSKSSLRKKEVRRAYLLVRRLLV